MGGRDFVKVFTGGVDRDLSRLSVELTGVRRPKMKLIV